MEHYDQMGAGLSACSSRRLISMFEIASAEMLFLSHYIQGLYRFPEGWTLRLSLSDDVRVTARAYRNRAKRHYVIEVTLGLVVWADTLAAALSIHVGNEFEGGEATEIDFEAIETSRTSEALFERVEVIDDLLRATPRHIGSTEMFFQQILYRIFLHEVAHVVRGHLDYLAGQSRRAMIDELGSRDGGGEDGPGTEAIRIFEFDADTHAALHFATLAIRRPEFLKRVSVNTDRENLVVGTLFAALFLVALENAERGAGMRSPHYPSPMMRIVIALVVSSTQWDDAYPNLDFWAEVALPMHQIIALFEDVYPGVDVLRDLPDRLTQIAQEWTDLQNEIERHDAILKDYAFDADWEFPIIYD